MVTNLDGCLDLTSKALARSGMYSFFARIYERALDKNLLDTFLSRHFHEAFGDTGINLHFIDNNQTKAQVLDRLAVEYTRLFVGPGKHISPHESVHREVIEGRLWGKSTVVVKNYIEACGFQYLVDNKRIPDHLSTEMEFMQKLTKMEAVARKNFDNATLTRSLSIQLEFMHEHLLIWIDRFCNKIIATANLPFYKEIATLTIDFLNYEALDIECQTL